MPFSRLPLVPEILKSHVATFSVSLVLYMFGWFGFSFWVPVLGLVAYISFVRFIPGQVPISATEVEKDTENEEVSGDEDHPEWTTQPGVERTEWINDIIHKIWPNTGKRILAEIESVLNGELSKSDLGALGVGEVKLNKFQLGDIPPRLGGVKIQGVSLDELILDSDLKYIGNSRIELSLTLNRFPQNIPLTVKNFTLSGKFRIICKPLLNHAPFVGGVRFSFLSIPELDFEPSGFLSILDLPGLRHFIHSRIINQVQDRLMFPRGITLQVPNRETDKDSSKEEKIKLPKGVFSLSLVEAKDLKNTDLSFLRKGVSDPYGTLSFSVDGKDHILKTETIKNCLDPKWNFQRIVFIDDPSTFSEINIRIYDKDIYSTDDLLGVSCVYSDVVSQVIRRETTYDYWKILEGTDQGSVRVRVSWSRFDLTPPRNTDDQAVVVVYLDSCRNIFGTETRKPDTRIKFSVGPQTCISKTIYNCKNPIFEERLVIFSNNPTNDDILIELLDAKDDSLLGSVLIELTQILSQENMILENKELTLNSSRIHGIRLKLSLALRFLQSEQFIFPPENRENLETDSKPSLTGSEELQPNQTCSEQIEFIDEGSDQDWTESSRTQRELEQGLIPSSRKKDDFPGTCEPVLSSSSVSEHNISFRGENKHNGEGRQHFRRSNTLPLQKVNT